MQATIKECRENGKNMTGEKETVARYHVVGIDDKGAIAEAVDCRVYMARKSDGASPVYASIWIHANGVHTAGNGRACGYGYHKESAAIGSALTSAGVVLSEDIDGRGDSSTRAALVAVGEALGLKQVMVIGS
ncbi:MAG TPA: hypothetical protein VFM46_10125 [Pseudomonadales bacterium]|nr:hypothetical protein [Pseudomonadales bacterium]